MIHDNQDRPVKDFEGHGKDTLHSSDSQINSLKILQKSIANDAKKEKETAFIGPPPEQVLDHLLQQIEAVNFRKEAELDPDDEDAKLKKNHYLIITIEKLTQIAKNNNWSLGKRDAFYYVYNGAYWFCVEKEDLKIFLQNVAEKMGVDKYQARFYEFAEQLFKQFETTAHLKKVKARRDVIKVNLTNGTFQITTKTQTLRPPNPDDFLTYQLPFAYNPQAQALRFRAYLNKVLPDLELQYILAEFIGYVFVSPSKLKLEKALLLYGSGANGKSVFFEVITALLGPDNVSHYSLQSLTNEPAYCRAHLINKLVNYASEINGKLEADTFKQMVSGEPVEARLPYGQPFIMTDYAKLIFNANELPTDVEHNDAFFRRFLIIPFNVTIPESEQDKQLSAKIIDSELSGVFNWVLEGLSRLLAQGRFTHSDIVRQQLEAYRRQSDNVQLFLDDDGYEKHEQYTNLDELYRNYKSYCIEGSYRQCNKKNFHKRLQTVGILTERKSHGYVAYIRKSGVL